MKTLLLFAVLGGVTFAVLPTATYRDVARQAPANADTKPVAKPQARPAAATASPRSGEAPRSGVVGTDVFGRTQIRYDNGVTAVTTPDPFGGSSTRYSNGETATTRLDPFGGSTTRYGNGVTATTRPDPFGGTSTTFSDGTSDDPCGSLRQPGHDVFRRPPRDDPAGPVFVRSGEEVGLD